MELAVNAGGLRVRIMPDTAHPSVRVRGRADYSNAGAIANALMDLAGSCERCVSLDLCEVESIDTAALEAMAASAAYCRTRRKRIHLRSASEPVRNLLNRLLLTDLFCTQDCDALIDRDACTEGSSPWEIDVFSLPCAMDHCQEARVRVDRAARAVGFSRSARADVMLAVGEAVANAIRHGKPAAIPGSFTVSCIATPERISVSVSDSGSGFEPEELPTACEVVLLENGRGIHCMRAVMDEVDFHFEAGTTVRMIKRGP